MKNRRTELLLSAALPLVMLSVGGTAAAQTTASAEPSQQASMLEEIVVTARKREESVQEVPISVAVVSGLQLQQRDLVTLESLTSLASGVTVQRTANNIASFYVRGLGTGPGNDSFENSVALFIDGTYAGRPPEGNQPIFDLERVEIIKGTQAALLAKNTSLGAFSTTTRKPGREFDYNLSASYEFELGSNLIDAGFDIPISDTLTVRLSGQTSVQDGWIRNDATGNDVPHSKSNAGRFIAVWTPTDSIDATFLYQQYKTEGLGLNEQYVVDLAGNARLRAGVAGFPGFETNFDRHLAASSDTFGDSDETNDGKRAILTLNYALGDFTLTSVSAYSEYTQDRAHFDNDELPGRWSDTNVNTGNKQFTQELRLSSPSGQRLNYVAGLFYLNEDWRYVRTVDVTRNSLTPAQQPITGKFFEDFRLNTSTFSGFGQGNYDLTDALTFSIGARVTNEQRTGDFFRQTLVPGVLTSVLYQAIAPTSRDIKDTNIDGSIGAQYKLNAGSLFYASYSHGTKSGGFISSPTTPATAYYSPEEADNYEIGGKFTFGRSILNAALFQTNVKNFQQTVFRGGAFQFDPQDLEAWGVEVESRFRLTDSLRVGGAVTYLQAERDNGTVPVNAPDWSGNVFANFEQPVGDNLLFSADAYLNFRSFVFYTVPALTLGYGPSTDIAANVLPGKSTTTLDGRLGIGSQDGRWQLALIGKNLTNEKSVSYARTATFVDGASVASLAKPRTITLQVSIRH